MAFWHEGVIASISFLLWFVQRKTTYRIYWKIFQDLHFKRIYWDFSHGKIYFKNQWWWQPNISNSSALLMHRRQAGPLPGTLPQLLKKHFWFWYWMKMRMINISTTIIRVINNNTMIMILILIIIMSMKTCKGRCDSSWHWGFSQESCGLFC